MFKDFKELLSALNAHKVRYLIIGGQAVEPREIVTAMSLLQSQQSHYARTGAAHAAAL